MDVKDLDFSLGHLGINQADDAEAKRTVAILGDLFGFASRETDGSYFVNEQFEVMKTPFLGRLGHVAILTANADEAKKYLEGKGIAFNEETASRSAEGKLMAIYFQDEIAGYAFHLKQK